MTLDRFLLLVATMTATIMQSLDMTIVNVALPHMMGTLGATTDSISWVVTSYMMAAAVFMPLTGFLTDRLGRKSLLLISMVGFVISSGLCGLADNLEEIVLFRLLQGVFGGTLLPLSQAIIIDNFPAAERGRAIAIWGMGVMTAPIMGPTLGGFLTEMSSWRWIFYINLPVGVVALLLVARLVPNSQTRERNMDWVGFITLAIAIACLQLVLDRGAEKDWFDSTMISTAACISLFSFIAFLWTNMRSLEKGGHPVFNLRVLKDRNLAISCIIMLFAGFSIFGGLLLLPLFLENQLGFPAMEAGIYLMPRGIMTFISMALVGRFAHHFDTRNIIGFGILVSVVGAVAMTRVTPQVPGSILLLPIMLQGFGIGFIFIPLVTLAYSTIPRDLTPEASGIYNLMRTIGVAIGVSIAATYLNYSAKVHWAELRGIVSPFNQEIHLFLQHTGQKAAYFFDPSGLHLNSLGVEVMAKVVSKQAMMQAYVSSYWLITASLIAMLPLLLLIKKTKAKEVDQELVTLE